MHLIYGLDEYQRTSQAPTIPTDKLAALWG